MGLVYLALFLYRAKGDTIWRLQFMTKCIKVVKPQWVH